MGESPYWIYGGKCTCRFIESEIWTGIQQIAKEIYYEFPDRPDRRLSIGDASPLVGRCDGHPVAHDDRKTIDWNYYTLGPTNHTQYVWHGEPITKIWKAGAQYEGHELLPGMFDAERNVAFLRKMFERFPMSDASTQDILYAEKKKVYPEIRNLRVRTDKARKYNHHKHGHFNVRI